MNITKLKNKTKILIWIVVLIGIIIRGCYSLEAKIYQIQYDLGIENVKEDGFSYDGVFNSNFEEFFKNRIKNKEKSTVNTL